MLDFIRDQEIYSIVVLEKISTARKFLWLATSDLKDLYVSHKKTFVPFLSVLSQLLHNGISIRLIHAKEPGKPFRDDFDKYPILADRLERLLCPRVHFKSVIIDGTFIYTGSANLTGAGMGSKSEGNRNFESGIISDEPWLIKKVVEQFDEVWMGKFCADCKYSHTCPDRDAMIHQHQHG
jgi:phosphatidylserine/phosphatidylglycerophosphate/cardiolipin synthase-like enzyme